MKVTDHFGHIEFFWIIWIIIGFINITVGLNTKSRPILVLSIVSNRKLARSVSLQYAIPYFLLILLWKGFFFNKNKKMLFSTLTILKLTHFFWEAYMNILTIFKVFMNCSCVNMLFSSPSHRSKRINWTFHPTTFRFINSCKLYSLKYNHFPSILIFWNSDWINVINTRNNINVWIA